MQNLTSLSNIKSSSNQTLGNFQRLFNYISNLSNLVAYYPLNEASGNALNYAPSTIGTMNGTVSGATQGISGQVGNAYSFDGISNNVDFGNDTSLNVGSGSLTFGHLVQVATVSNKFSLSSRSGLAASNGGYDILVGDGGIPGKILTRIADGTSTYQTGTATVTTNAWHLLVGVVNRTNNTLGLYADNQAIVTLDITGSLAVSNSQNLFAAKRGTTFFGSLIQHVFILSRVITAAEVLKIAQLSGVA